MKKGNNTKTYTAEQTDDSIAEREDQTDWGKVYAMTDAKRQQLIGEDPDESGFEPDWTKVELVISHAKQKIGIRFDLDVLDWFK